MRAAYGRGMSRYSVRMSLMCTRLLGWVMGGGLLLLGGCSGYRDPSIALSESKLADVSDEAVALKFTLDLHNPNTEPLKLLQFKYDVDIDGKRVYSGTRAAEATLASASARRIDIPAIVRLGDVGWNRQALPAHVQYSVSGRLEYVTPGDIAQMLLDTGVRKPKVSFFGAGEVALTPPVAPATSGPGAMQK